MKYGSKTNTVLLVTLLATTAIAWYSYRESAGLDPRVAQIEWDAVGAITVELRGRTPLAFRRVPGGWRLEAPVVLDAAPRRLQEIIHALNVPSEAQYPAGEVDLAQLGLAEPPVARVTVDGAAFSIGEANPVSGWRYVRSGDTVHMVHDVLYFRLLGDAQSWSAPAESD